LSGQPEALEDLLDEGNHPLTEGGSGSRDGDLPSHLQRSADGGLLHRGLVDGLAQPSDGLFGLDGVLIV
jgi:hypothetical protein